MLDRLTLFPVPHGIGWRGSAYMEASIPTACLHKIHEIEYCACWEEGLVPEYCTFR